MKITQLRNATIKVEYAGKKFLIDPVLAEKGAYPAFQGTPNSDKFNPLVDLPLSIEEILDADAVIVTHTHSDHWDEAARKLVPRDMPVFVQNENDAAALQAAGFSDTRILGDGTVFEGVALVKTAGRHGSDEAMEKMGDRLGEVCGVVFKHPAEKTLYLAGDTVWNEYVKDALSLHAPEIIVLNCGDAQIFGLGSIIMGKSDLYEVSQAAPHATIIASHMEAMNHAVLSRKELREFLQAKDLTQRVLVPEDGESYQL